MFKQIDGEQNVNIEGYVYTNRDGSVEGVAFEDGESYVSIGTLSYGRFDDEFGVYIEDIPKMIKALQAAYDHKQ